MLPRRGPWLVIAHSAGIRTKLNRVMPPSAKKTSTDQVPLIGNKTNQSEQQRPVSQRQQLTVFIEQPSGPQAKKKYGRHRKVLQPDRH
jgi:hypothetical protein